MGITLFNKGNERLHEGLDYDNFLKLATSASDTTKHNEAFGERSIRLTKDGKGIATTTFSGTSGARVGQVAGARTAFLDAVERKYGLNARIEAEELLKEDGKFKPLTSRIITDVNWKFDHASLEAVSSRRFIASQRDVFDRALEDAVVSAAKQYPDSMINIYPLKIEEGVFELMKTKRVPMTSQALAGAVARLVAESVAKANDADEVKAAKIREVAVKGVNKSAGTAPMPKIRSQAEFVTFFKSLHANSQYGKIQKDEVENDVNGEPRQTYVFKGIVFRSSLDTPTLMKDQGGLKSRNDLSVPENKTEAMGLGVINETTGRAAGWGATGKNGVSTARTVAGAIVYLNPNCTFYVIDTTKLPKKEKAWDMEYNVYKNGLLERRMEKVEIKDKNLGDKDEFVEVPLDETKNEVNISDVPKNAIIGWINVPPFYYPGENTSAQGKLQYIQDRLFTLNKDSAMEHYEIEFNPDYDPDFEPDAQDDLEEVREGQARRDTEYFEEIQDEPGIVHRRDSNASEDENNIITT